MTNQDRMMMCVVDIERLIHECVPGGDICDPQQVADAIREYAAAARTVGEYPPLPEWMERYSIPNDDFNNSSDSCLADRMRSYVDADRAMRAQAVPAAQGELLKLLADIKHFDIQNLVLDLPQDIRARIERALIGRGGAENQDKQASAYGEPVAWMSENDKLFSDQINAAIDAARGRA